MSFWSGDKLEKIGPTIKLVEPFNADQIDCSAYQLSLGEECFVTPRFGDTDPNRKQRLEARRTVRVGGSTRTMTGGEMIIPAGRFAFLLTEEYVRIPVDAMGFISLRSKQKWKGLINVSGFHVDPGFHGRLVYSVYNAGPSNIHLSRGETPFLLWIADLSDASSRHVKGPADTLDEIPSDLISNIDRPLHSLQSLSEKVEAIQRELSLVYRVLGILGVLAGLTLAIWALVPVGEDSPRRVEAADVL